MNLIHFVFTSMLIMNGGRLISVFMWMLCEATATATPNAVYALHDSLLSSLLSGWPVCASIKFGDVFGDVRIMILFCIFAGFFRRCHRHFLALFCHFRKIRQLAIGRDNVDGSCSTLCHYLFTNSSLSHRIKFFSLHTWHKAMAICDNMLCGILKCTTIG